MSRWHRPVVLLLGLLAVAGFGVLGVLAGDRPTALGYEDPAAESARAHRLLAQAGAGPPNLALLVDAPAPVTEPEQVAAGRRMLTELAGTAGVRSAQSYWDTRDPGLVSDDRHTTLVRVLVGGDEPAAQRHAAQVSARFAGQYGPFRVAVAGPAYREHYLESLSRVELGRAELVSLPLLALVVLWVYRSAAATLLLLMVGGVTAVGAYATLSLLARHLDVSVYALSIATMVGLGLAFDYSLIMVSRFREELAGRGTTAAALAAMMRGSGRTVAFSALTVTLSLCPLLLFPQPALRSLGLAILTVVGFACGATLLLVPAALALLGRRIGPDRGWHRAQREWWGTLARWVVRRRWRVLPFGIGVLLLLGLPVAGLHTTVPDHRWLAADAAPRLTTERIAAELPTAAASVHLVVLPTTPVGDPAIAGYAAALARLPGVRSATPQPLAEHGSWLAVGSEHPPASAAAGRQVRAIRTVSAPGPSLVGGEPAAFLDLGDDLRSRLPWMVGFVILGTVIVLFALTRSVLLPVKALVANGLTVLAGFGMMTYLFQEGHLGALIGHTATGGIHPIALVFVFAVTFGISMDYEVLLLARTREAYRRGGDNREAIVAGARRTWRVVTASALVLAIPLIALATSSATTLKMIGVVLAFAVALDATLVRCLLVPAFMAIAGRWNWWAPGPVAGPVPGPVPDPVPDPVAGPVAGHPVAAGSEQCRTPDPSTVR